MGTTANGSCAQVHGNAAAFVVNVQVEVDGTVVASLDHTPPPVGGDPWPFSVALNLSGTHTIRVTDVAASGPTRYDVLELVVDCPAAPTTTAAPVTTTAPTTTVAPLETSLPIVTAPQVVVETVPSVVLTETTAAATTTTEPVHLVGTAPVPSTVAEVQATTPTANTLPATGATTAPMISAGLVALVLGYACIRATRRPRPA